MIQNKIESISYERVEIPLEVPFVTARHRVDSINAIEVKVRLSSGLVGVGSATPNEVVTGDSMESIIHTISTKINPSIVGSTIDNWENLLRSVRTSVFGQTPAKAAVEMALYDLRSQLFNTSLTTMLGGAKTFITTDFTVGLSAPVKMIKRIEAKVAEGFHSIKIKLGESDYNEDLELLRMLSSKAWNGISFRIDANQAWTVQQTKELIDFLKQSSLEISFIEQPLRADDLQGMRDLVAYSDIPIMADESVHSANDALKVLTSGAADLINIKLMKSGGISEAERINQLCELFNVPVMVGCMIESEVGISAAVSFACAHDNVKYTDLDSIFMIRSSYSGNRIIRIKEDKIYPFIRRVGD